MYAVKFKGRWFNTIDGAFMDEPDGYISSFLHRTLEDVIESIEEVRHNATHCEEKDEEPEFGKIENYEIFEVEMKEKEKYVSYSYDYEKQIPLYKEEKKNNYE